MSDWAKWVHSIFELGLDVFVPITDELHMYLYGSQNLWHGLVITWWSYYIHSGIIVLKV